jgi:hypothetical protein
MVPPFRVRSNVPVQRRRGSAVRSNRLLGVIVPLAPEYNMGGFLRRNELNAFVSESAHVNPLEQSLSPAQQDRRDSDVQLIDEARTKILLDSVSPNPKIDAGRSSDRVESEGPLVRS